MATHPNPTFQHGLLPLLRAGVRDVQDVIWIAISVGLVLLSLVYVTLAGKA